MQRTDHHLTIEYLTKLAGRPVMLANESYSTLFVHCLLIEYGVSRLHALTLLRPSAASDQAQLLHGLPGILHRLLKGSEFQVQQLLGFAPVNPEMLARGAMRAFYSQSPLALGP